MQAKSAGKKIKMKKAPEKNSFLYDKMAGLKRIARAALVIVLLFGCDAAPESEKGEKGAAKEKKAAAKLNVGCFKLIRGAEEGDIEKIKKALEKKCNVDYKDLEGDTALIKASRKGHYKAAKYLIYKGADVNMIGSWGPPLAEAAAFGHADIVKLLIKSGADINTRIIDNYNTLTYAAAGGHIEVITLIIAKSIDLNCPDRDKMTNLLWALEYGHSAPAELLINEGADINVADSFGMTPLMWAAKQGYPDVAKLLIKKGADIDKRNKKGETALMLAEKNGFRYIEKLIKKAKVKRSKK